MTRTHTYKTSTTWTGNTGAGTTDFRSYARSYDLSAALKPTISGSSDPAFRGDSTCWNPEELLVAAISACHQLWFLHLCSQAGVVVQEYHDAAEGTMEANADGSARFDGVTLRPKVTVRHDAAQALVESLHRAAHAKCLIAQSVNFVVKCEPATVYTYLVPASVLAV